MSDRRTLSPDRAFLEFLSRTTRNIVAIERRDQWPAAVHTAGTEINAASPYAKQNRTSPLTPITTHEVTSLVLPAGRWVVNWQSAHSFSATETAGGTDFAIWSEFTVDGVQAALRGTGFFINGLIATTGDTHRLAESYIFTAPATVTIRVGMTYDNAAQPPGDITWVLNSFIITAVPG